MKTLLFEKAIGILNLALDTDYQVLDFGCGKGELLGALSGRIAEIWGQYTYFNLFRLER